MVRCKKCKVCIRHATKKTRLSRLCGVCRGVVTPINRRFPTERAIKRVIKSKRLNAVDLKHYKEIAKRTGLIHEDNSQ